MSAVEKVKKKKKGKGLATGKNKKTVDVAQETDNKQKIEELAADTVSHGSVISVQEAKDEAKQDYTEKEDDDKMSSPIQYEDSKQENDPEPTTSKNISRPTSVTSHRSGQLGSSASVQSKEAWTDNKICTVTPSDGKGRENSSRSLSSKEPSPLFVPPEMNESHAYVPFLYARDTIAKITEDMKKMKYKHVDIIREIDLNYKNIEDDTQTQFNMFVITMQQKYVQKVKTFRQVIDVHRMELQHKQQYWDEVIQSLSQRNKQLLNEKKQLLILNKQQHEKLEQEKEHVARDLMLKLDAKEKEIAKLKQLMRKKEHEFEEDKERELKNMENILRQEWDKEKRELEETIEDLKSNPNVVTESVQHSSAPGDAKVVSDLERKLREKDNMLLLCKRTASDREAELEKEKMILQQDVKRLEQQNSKLKKKQSGEVDSDSDLEKQIEDLENKVMELELALRAAELDKKHYMNINQDQKDYLSELEDQLKEADIRVQHLLMSADESEKAGSQLNNANRELDKLKRKAKRLEEELTAKSEEMADHDLKAEKLRSEMEKDMKKMLKEIAKLRKQVEEKEDPPQEPSQMEKKIEKMEGSVIDFEHKISILTSDRDYFSAKSKVLKDRVIELEEEVHLADKTIAQLRAKSAISDFYKKQYMETQQNVDDLKQKIKDLKQDLLYKQQELRDSQHRSEQALWQETKKQTKLVFDMKKLTKQIANLEKKLKKSETAASDDSENKDSEETINSLQDKLLEAEREHDLIKQQYKDMRARCQDLERRLVMAEENLEQNQHNEDVAASLEAAEAEVKALKQKIEVFENQLATKQQEIEEKEADVKDKERKLKNIQLEHRDQLREKDKMIKELEKEIRKLKWQLAKLKEKLGLSDKDSAGEMGTDMNDLEDKVTELEKKIVDLEAEKELMKMENDSLKQANKQLEIVLHQQQETTEIQESGAPLAMSTPVPSDGSDIQELNQQIADLQKEVDQKEVEIIQERANHNVTREELERTTIQLEKLSLELENLKTESQARLETTETKLNTEIENLKQRLSESEKQREKLEADQVANIPPDTAVIINDLRVKLKAQEEEKTGLSKEKVELEAKIKTLQARINQLENTSKADKVSNTGIMDNLKQLRIEKDREIRQIQNEAQRKELQRAEQERKKINILEQKIKQLEEAGSGSTGKAQTGTQGLQALQARLREAKQEISELKSKNKRLENDLRRGSGATGGLAVDVEAEKRFKKQAKILKEMEKIVEMEQQKNKKNEERIKKLEEELKETQKNLKEKEQELEKLKAEMAALGVSAKAAKDLSQEVEKLKAEVSQLTKENKILAENFNSERILRKKYYNMVEDMKGKIRVYCRVRPMSKSELDRGNHSVIKSPDEYSVIVDSNRGPKEFQFDQVFMPEASQEKIFEDTNNLIQSAVDGYNVCIFAYGQTGSGKTYTIIGDREQKNPGIAPRAFERIFDLLQENKSKFSYKCSCYMLELYNDRLIDLFSKPAANAEDKLEIKKDQKGMVFVQGAAVKSAKNAQQLNALFEEGSKNRHTASTKMNLESSRSHLVIGIVIETTNRTTGALLKGKLSLVDLAGSERAAKTGASAEQLKEAMSINKSLSALGDVISALSSEQQFIPYRNNKLTMLMQDSLGGNAKTLMFVNVSPADYNADETVVSLTYASRVKLITNDAQKNAENKEIARLKNIIAKLKKGETAPEAEEVV